MPSPTFVPASPALVLQPESAELDYADKATYTQVYRGPYSLCVSSASPKGTLGTGALAGYTVIRSTVSREPRGIGKLTTIWELTTPPGGTQLPPDEVAFEPWELNPRIEKHPRYAGLADVGANHTNFFQAIRDALNHPDEAVRSTAEFGIKDAVVGNALAAELLEKLQKGQDTFYRCGIKYTHSFHSLTAPACTIGGYIETPTGPLASSLSSFQCLRQADSLVWTGSFWKCTRTWLAAPDADWDSDLYTAS
jgi:hypothetical protein